MIVMPLRSMPLTDFAIFELLFLDAGSATSEFIVVRTPTNKEHARIPRKRKCLFDEKIVLSNEYTPQTLTTLHVF